MTSFIIFSKDKIRRQKYIQKYCKELGINPVDITVIEKETAIKQNVQSIGIEEIKNLRRKLFLKPIKSPTKAVVIEDAQLLTTEAQNSMLKILEEPPDHTIIFLSADSREVFLPTIISRCKVIELEKIELVLTETEEKELNEFIKELSTMNTGMRLKHAEILAKDKEKALDYVEKLIFLLREKMLNEIDSRKAGQSIYPEKIKIFQGLYTLMKTTNVNTRFAIENALLSVKK